MQAKANIQNEHKVVLTVENNKKRFEDPNFRPLEMLFTYQSLINDLTEAIDAIQLGGNRKNRERKGRGRGTHTRRASRVLPYCAAFKAYNTL